MVAIMEKSGELLGTPNVKSRAISSQANRKRNKVGWKVQRLMVEDALPIIPTRAPDPKGMI
jgi:hypothetical protein